MGGLNRAMVAAKLKQVLLALVNRGGGMVLQFASLWAVAQAVNVQGVGTYAFYTSWMTVLAALSGFGSATYTLRTVAVCVRAGQHTAILTYLKKMALLLGASGLVTLAVMVGLLETLGSGWGMDASLRSQLYWAATGSLAFMLMRLMSESLKALALPNISMSLETMLIPALLIALTLGMHASGRVLAVEAVIGAHILLLFLAAGLMLGFVLHATRRLVPKAPADPQPPPLLNKSLLPLWGSSLLGMLFLNLPILLLPTYANAEEMGLFSIAYRFINVCVSLLMVIASIYGPRFAQEYAARDPQALRQSLKQTQWLSLGLYAPLFVVFMVAPGWVMGLFGAAFSAGAPLLVAMAVGQLVYASTGLVGMMMNMIHREQQEFWIALAATAVMATLISVLGAAYGVWGVAVGFGVGLGLKNVASWVAVRRCLGRIEPLGSKPGTSK